MECHSHKVMHFGKRLSGSLLGCRKLYKQVLRSMEGEGGTHDIMKCPTNKTISARVSTKPSEIIAACTYKHHGTHTEILLIGT